MAANVYNLHIWLQPMEIVDALQNRKSRAREWDLRFSRFVIGLANYDNMRYYGGLIVFF